MAIATQKVITPVLIPYDPARIYCGPRINNDSRGL